jgi:hypothetical protein
MAVHGLTPLRPSVAGGAAGEEGKVECPLYGLLTPRTMTKLEEEREFSLEISSVFMNN